MGPNRDITQRRRRPVQKRSIATFESICAAASQILIEEGLDRLNTNAVADRAGVSITAVYAYFPDKYAILHELLVRSDERWRRAIDLRDRFAGTYDPTELQAQLLAGARARIEDPEYRALRAAVWAVPELAELQAEMTSEAVDRLATSLRAHNPRLTSRDAHRAARVLVVSADAAIDDCVRRGQFDRAFLEQAESMTGAYLDRVLTAGIRQDAGDPAVPSS